MSNIKEFIRLANAARFIVNSGADWEDIFELIFAHLAPDIRATGVSVNWCDPDGSYEEDVRAYVSAVTERAESLQRIIDAVESQP